MKLKTQILAAILALALLPILASANFARQIPKIGSIDYQSALSTTPYQAFSGSVAGSSSRVAADIGTATTNTDGVWVLILPAAATPPANLAAVTSNPLAYYLNPGDKIIGGAETGQTSVIYLASNSGTQAATIVEKTAPASAGTRLQTYAKSTSGASNVSVISSDLITTLTAGATGTASNSLVGYYGAGCYLTVTGSETITPYVSYDGGSHWIATNFVTPSGAIQAVATSTGGYSIVAMGGVSNVQLSWTGSGSVSGTLRSTTAQTLNDLVTQLQGGSAVGSGNPLYTQFASAQPISAASLPLPSGAAQEGGNLATLAGTVGSGKLKVGKAITLLGAALGATNGQIASGAHFLSRLIGDNASSTTLYLMVFDASSLPANNSVPIAQVMVPFGISTSPTENVRQFGEDWITNSTGLWYAWSTTSGVLTLASSGTGLGVEAYGG